MALDVRDAILTVLREADGPLHWTAVQDRALRAGLIDPFTQTDVRKQVLSALAGLARDGAVRKVGTGVYEAA